MNAIPLIFYERKLFGIEDFMKLSEFPELKGAIRKAYEKEAESKGFEAIESYTSDKLIKKANGIAKLDECFLIYFHPYNIGLRSRGPIYSHYTSSR